MATEVTYSELQCVVNVHAEFKTKRFCILKYQVNSLRIVELNYQLERFGTRQCYFQTNPLSNARFALIKLSDKYVESDNRFGFTPKGLPGQNSRYAVFIPNASRIIATTSIILPVYYSDNRTATFNTSPLTQRYICLSLKQFSVRQCCISVLNEHIVSTTNIIQSISKFSERKVFTTSINNSSSRNATYTTQDTTERYVLLKPFTQSIVTTPKVYESLSGLINERICFTHTYNPLSERLIFVQRNPDSIRYATFNYTLSSDRSSVFVTSQVKLLHDTYIIQCHPYYNERYGITKGYLNLSERTGVCETGDMYTVKSVYSGTPLLVIKSKDQNDSVFKVFTSKKAEVHTDGISVSQEQINLSVNEITGITDKNTISMYAVENTKGTAISQFVDKKKKYLATGKFIADVGIQYATYRTIFVESM